MVVCQWHECPVSKMTRSQVKFEPARSTQRAHELLLVAMLGAGVVCGIPEATEPKKGVLEVGSSRPPAGTLSRILRLADILNLIFRLPTALTLSQRRTGPLCTGLRNTPSYCP